MTQLHPPLSAELLARAMPAGFAWFATAGVWIPAPHLMLLNKYLLGVASGRIKRLLIEMPPRHGKSMLISQYFPAWYLGRFPDRQVLLASYEATFAASWGRKARDALAARTSLFGVKVREDTSAASWWETEKGGGMITAGVGGPITGKGAHLFIIDDPIKNPEEAFSRTYREKIWDWYRSVVYTRLEPNGAIVLVMTRWHQDDLAGRLKASGEKWDCITLPAIAEEDDPLGRKPGDALWPERFPPEDLERIRQAIGAYWWAAMYQQRPAPAGGGLFRREAFRYFRESDTHYILLAPDGERSVPKSECLRFAAVDLAVSLREMADYTVIMVCAISKNRELLVLDIVRKRLEGPDIVPLMKQVHARYALALLLVERSGFQLAIVQEARRAGLPIRDVSADTDKWARAQPAAALVDSGRVYFRAGSHWLADFEDELLSFPNAAHDDQVDALAYACAALPRLSPGRAVSAWWF